MNAVTVIEQADKPTLWLDIPKGQSFEEWQATGEKLRNAERVLNWHLGDWWAAGHHRYGERAKIAAEGVFGVGFQAIMDMATVCRSFEPSRRREALSFSHHRETASLPPEEADTLLDSAIERALAVRELRIVAVKRKTELGIFKPRDRSDADLDDDGFKDISRKWNRWHDAARILVLQSIEETGAIRILDESLIRDIVL